MIDSDPPPRPQRERSLTPPPSLPPIIPPSNESLKLALRGGEKKQINFPHEPGTIRGLYARLGGNHIPGTEPEGRISLTVGSQIICRAPLWVLMAGYHLPTPVVMQPMEEMSIELSKAYSGRLYEIFISICLRG
jgi:hypothetical protein